MLGVIVTASLTAALYFAKFWRNTRDPLFLAFAFAFAVEGLNRIGILFLDRPNEGSPTIYVVRMLAFILILAAVLWKNRRSRRR